MDMSAPWADMVADGGMHGGSEDDDRSDDEAFDVLDGLSPEAQSEYVRKAQGILDKDEVKSVLKSVVAQEPEAVVQLYAVHVGADKFTLSVVAQEFAIHFGLPKDESFTFVPVHLTDVRGTTAAVHVRQSLYARMVSQQPTAAAPVITSLPGWVFVNVDDPHFASKAGRDALLMHAPRLVTLLDAQALRVLTWPAGLHPDDQAGLEAYAAMSLDLLYAPGRWKKQLAEMVATPLDKLTQAEADLWAESTFSVVATQPHHEKLVGAPTGHVDHFILAYACTGGPKAGHRVPGVPKARRRRTCTRTASCACMLLCACAHTRVSTCVSK